MGYIEKERESWSHLNLITAVKSTRGGRGAESYFTGHDTVSP